MWIKITSHRARHKIKQANIKTLELVNWPSMDHYSICADAERKVIDKIKGVTILKKRPKGEFTRCW